MVFPFQKRNRDVVLIAKILHMACSALFLALGVISSFWDFDGARHVVVGIACVLIGGASVFGYFSNDAYRLAFQCDFAFGVFDVILGVMVLIAPSEIIELFPVAIAVLAVLDGGVKGQVSIEGASFGMHYWFLVTLCALCEIGVGITTVFCAYKNISEFFWIGIAMMVMGAVNVFTTAYTVRLTNEKKD